MRALVVSAGLFLTVGAVACGSDPPREDSTTCDTARSTVVVAVAGITPVTPIDYVVLRREVFHAATSEGSYVDIIEEHGTPSAVARERIDRLRFCDDAKC